MSLPDTTNWREWLGIETELVRAYYAIEVRRHPNAESSARLLD